jgi:uncharacterized protein YaeQ
LVANQTERVAFFLWVFVEQVARAGQQDVIEEGKAKKENTFMVEDDDVHLIAEQIPQNIRYQVMVHFDDGTVSGLTQKVHPQ